MKFGKQLELGQYMPWQSSYLAYKQLKRIIVRRAYLLKIDNKSSSPVHSENKGKDKIRKKDKDKTSGNKHEKHHHSDESASDMDSKLSSTTGYGATMELSSSVSEHSPLLSAKGGGRASTPNIEDDCEDFFEVVEAELAKVNKFVIGKLAELRLAVADFTVQSEDLQRSHHSDGDRTQLLRMKDTYIQLVALNKFCSLNSTGFIKIIKKYDKQFGTDFLSSVWNARIEQEFVTTTTEPHMLLEQFSTLISRDHLVEWQQSELEGYSDQMDEKHIFKSVKVKGLVISFVLFVLSYALPLSATTTSTITNDNDADTAKRCLSLLIFVISLWVTEAIPYFTTALLVPVLVSCMTVLRQPVTIPETVDANGQLVTPASVVMTVMTVKEAAKFAMSHMFNHTSVLILGGYTISSAFSRCQLELHIASYLQRLLGASPKLFMLSIMFLGLFLAMWISNHTAPILCTAIIAPIIADLPRDCKYSRALLLGLAFACNFGGLMTPISSLQNVIAVSQLAEIGVNVSFGRWILCSAPFAILGTLISWFVITYITHVDNEVKKIPIVVVDLENRLLTTKNLVIMSTSLLTCFLFASFSLFSDYFGDIGVISLCYMGFMFGTGILTEVDFHALRWQSIMLLGGGSVLGQAVDTSGLLELIANVIISVLPLNSPRIAVLVVTLFVCLVSTFVSHTVAALILIPLVLKLGVSMGIPAEMVICCAFAVSAGMALPFSSFPNVNSLLVVDDLKKSYIKTEDFLMTGVTMSGISIVLLVTLVFTLIQWLIDKY